MKPHDNIISHNQNQNNELSILFWNVLADVYLKYYDPKIKNIWDTYIEDLEIKPTEVNHIYRKERLLKNIQKMNPDIIGLVEIQDNIYNYLRSKLKNYNFTEIISDNLDEDKIKYGFPLEGKCIMYKKSLNIDVLNGGKCHVVDIGRDKRRKTLDFHFIYNNKECHYLVHHNSPVYMISVDKHGNYLNKEDEKYEEIFHDKDTEPELNQIIEIYKGVYKKFMRGNAVLCIKNLVDYIEENITSNPDTILFIGGDFNSQPSYPKVQKSHVPEYIEKISRQMKDLHGYRNEKTFMSTRHDGRRLDYLFYDSTNVKAKYIHNIQSPIYEETRIDKKWSEEYIQIIKQVNKKKRIMNYSHQLMQYGSDHQPIFGKFIL